MIVVLRAMMGVLFTSHHDSLVVPVQLNPRGRN